MCQAVGFVRDQSVELVINSFGNRNQGGGVPVLPTTQEWPMLGRNQLNHGTLQGVQIHDSSDHIGVILPFAGKPGNLESMLSTRYGRLFQAKKIEFYYGLGRVL